MCYVSLKVILLKIDICVCLLIECYKYLDKISFY